MLLGIIRTGFKCPQRDFLQAGCICIGAADVCSPAHTAARGASNRVAHIWHLPRTLNSSCGTLPGGLREDTARKYRRLCESSGCHGGERELAAFIAHWPLQVARKCLLPSTLHSVVCVLVAPGSATSCSTWEKVGT